MRYLKKFENFEYRILLRENTDEKKVPLATLFIYNTTCPSTKKHYDTLQDLVSKKIYDGQWKLRTEKSNTPDVDKWYIDYYSDGKLLLKNPDSFRGSDWDTDRVLYYDNDGAAMRKKGTPASNDEELVTSGVTQGNFQIEPNVTKIHPTFKMERTGHAVHLYR